MGQILSRKERSEPQILWAVEKTLSLAADFQLRRVRVELSSEERKFSQAQVVRLIGCAPVLCTLSFRYTEIKYLQYIKTNAEPALKNKAFSPAGKPGFWYGP